MFQSDAATINSEKSAAQLWEQYGGAMATLAVLGGHIEPVHEGGRVLVQVYRRMKVVVCRYNVLRFLIFFNFENKLISSCDHFKQGGMVL